MNSNSFLVMKSKFHKLVCANCGASLFEVGYFCPKSGYIEELETVFSCVKCGEVRHGIPM